MPPFFLPSTGVRPEVFKIALNKEKTVESMINNLDSTALGNVLSDKFSR